LVDEAALEPAAHAGELAHVEGQVLLLGHADRDVREAIQPRCAAELAPARADAARDAGLFARAHAAEADARAEARAEVGGERAEIEALLARVEDRERRAVEAPIAPEHAHGDASLCGDARGDLARVRFLPLVLREEEAVRRGRLSDDAPERRIDLDHRRVG